MNEYCCQCKFWIRDKKYDLDYLQFRGMTGWTEFDARGWCKLDDCLKHYDWEACEEFKPL